MFGGTWVAQSEKDPAADLSWEFHRCTGLHTGHGAYFKKNIFLMFEKVIRKTNKQKNPNRLTQYLAIHLKVL